MAFSENLLAEIAAWKEMSLDIRPEAWVFPSEKTNLPIRKDNLWRRLCIAKTHLFGKSLIFREEAETLSE